VSLEVDARAERGVRNSQPEGIGRVASIGDLVAWNNLGRNIVFADRHLRPVSVFAATRFWGDDELSQYDLDVHAILAAPGRDLVVALNHLGLLYMFRRSHLTGPGGYHEVHPFLTTFVLPDMERAVLAGSRLVGSCPRSEGAIGLVVSEPLESARDGAPLGAVVVGDDLGEVTALGCVGVGDGPLVVVGGPGQAAVVALRGETVTSPRWRVDVPFRAAVVDWDGRFVWVAGPAQTSVVGDYDWELLHGGGFVALDPVDGEVVISGSLPHDVAWGTGGSPVVCARSALGAVGRSGSLHLLDGGSVSWRSTPPLASGSLGIAHATRVERTVLYGFNRGGYRLWTSVPTTAPVLPD
jgi:hypothetical protein